MPKALVVVESPSKAKTINKYLGKDFKVVASRGHVRDLPKSDLSVEISEDKAVFKPIYKSIKDKQKVIQELKAAAKGVDQLYVATDPDREGEAIGWHIASLLGDTVQKVGRLLFNEITKKAVLAALEEEREIDRRMVDAQQARRVLDRIVGYQISPLLWKKAGPKLSAGRVQSVALKLVCDREGEIDRFQAEEYWHIFGRLAGNLPPEFSAKVNKKGKHALKIANEGEAKAVVSDLEQAQFLVSSVTTKESSKKAPPPFITSKLQQTARFPVKKTMEIAQKLYEGIELPGEGMVGLITYMRTDSTRVSEEAIADVRTHIGQLHGGEFLPEKPYYFKTKAGAQDAHEAIRPTSMQYTPEVVRAHLTKDQHSLYRLIWNRFVASQMVPARFDDTSLVVEAGDYTLQTKGSVQTFAGWLVLYQAESPSGVAGEVSSESEGAAESGESGSDTALLPKLVVGEPLQLLKLDSQQKFTQPPARFSEATLVKKLEDEGIGRPSTYAQIISNLQTRNYTTKVEKRFQPTQLGRTVQWMVEACFQDFVAVDYTRGLEEQLDKVEGGNDDWQTMLQGFYGKFSQALGAAEEKMPFLKAGIPIDEIPWLTNLSRECKCSGGQDKCTHGEVCDKPILLKMGKYGPFLACSDYPACKYTGEVGGPEPEETEPCEKCGKPMVLKQGKFGPFWACSGYPDCKNTFPINGKPDQILEETCPKCDSNLVLKQGKFGEFTSCSNYPDCKYIKLKPTGVLCPKDGGDIVERKSKRGKPFYGCNNYPKCDFVLWNRPLAEPCPSCGAPFVVEKITKKWGHQVLCNSEDCDYERIEEGGRPDR
ncbi:MAG: DNA topoisomerase I [Acidobacteria bacterium]|nr:DNA topoisomerase I [Acidobacteriota bacterium]|tara:strand:- start:7724 stop:10189 length:2466 start_codon:yes stop_codon:yes gene_type:complete